MRSPAAGLARRIARRIARDGPVPFAAFMEEALYGEGGYYARERVPIGRRGDFLTGASDSPLFARATARLLRRLDPLLGGRAELLEAGYGNGEHLAAVAAASAGEGRRLRGWDRVARPLPEGVERVGSLDEVGEREVEGLIFAYELFDALPVHRLVGRAGGGLGELLVGLDEEGRFAWREGEPSRPGLAGLTGGVELAPRQVADLSPGWRPLAAELARRLGRGALLVFDYGFERRRLLDPRVRRHGTLACYRGHRVHRDPFADPGGQDLTAHVDLTAVVEGAEAAGLRLAGRMRQAEWLVACGLFEELGEGADLEVRTAAARLLDPAGMGGTIQVLIFARGVDLNGLFDPPGRAPRAP